MKNKVINTAVCDARGLKEESLAGLEKITINTCVLVIGEKAKSILNKYPVTLNAASVLEIPDDRDAVLKTVNGKCDIGPDAEGENTLLMVNGKLTIENGGLEAAKRYIKITVNGKALMPKSFKGRLGNLLINGKAEYYPDGAALLRPNARIDRLFIARAENTRYHCPGNLFFMDTDVDWKKALEKGLRFSAKKAVVAEGLLNTAVALLDEETEVTRVMDGAVPVFGDIELTQGVIKKHGARLCVCGDVAIHDAEALASLEYLFADGTVSLDKNLEEAFNKIKSVYQSLKILAPDARYISDRPMVKVSAAMLESCPGGVWISDCARVELSESLSREDIVKSLHISDCALVVCNEEQEDAARMIAEDVAMLRVSGREKDADSGDGGFGDRGDTQIINAAEYRL